MPDQDVVNFVRTPTSLYAIAQKPTLYQEYKAYTASKYVGENIDFIEAYEAGVSIDKLYLNFVAPGSPREINISHSTRTDVYKMMTDGAAHSRSDLFSDCVHDIVKLFDSNYGNYFADDPNNYPHYIEEEFGAELRSHLGVTPAQMPTDTLVAVFKDGYVARKYKAEIEQQDREPTPMEASYIAKAEASIARTLQEAGLTVTKENVSRVMEHTMSPQAEAERELRRMLKVPDEKAAQFHAFFEATHEDTQGDAARETDREDRQQLALEDMRGAGPDGPDMAKVLYLTESMAKAKDKQAKIDALRAGNANQTQIDTATREMDKSKAAVVQQLGLIGIPAIKASQFADGYANGDLAAIDQIVPDRNVLATFSEAEKTALDNAYRTDVVITNDAGDALTPDEFFAAEARKGRAKADLAALKQNADVLALAAKVKASKDNPKKEAVAALKQLIDRLIAETNPDIVFSEKDMWEFCRNQPAPHVTDTPATAPAGTLADVFSDLSFPTLKTDYGNADPTRQKALIKEGLQIAKALIASKNFGIDVTEADVEAFLTGNAPSAAPPTAQPSGTLADVFSDQSFATLKTDYGTADPTRQKALVKEGLQIAKALIASKAYGINVTEGDVEAFLKGTARADAEPGGTLADVFNNNGFTKLKTAFAKADRKQRRAVVQKGMQLSELVIAQKGLNVKITHEDMVMFLADRMPVQPDPKMDRELSEFEAQQQKEAGNYEIIAGSAKMQALIAQFRSETDKAKRGKLMDKAIAEAKRVATELQLDLDFDEGLMADYIYEDVEYPELPTPEMTRPEQLKRVFANKKFEKLKKVYQKKFYKKTRDAIMAEARDFADFYVGTGDDQFGISFLGKITDAEILSFFNSAGNTTDDARPAPPPGGVGTPRKTDPSVGDDAPDKTKDALIEIKHLLAARDIKAASKLAKGLEGMAREHGGPLSGKTSNDIMRMMAAKVRAEKVGSRAADGADGNAAPPPVKIATDVPMSVLKTFKWSRFKKVYRVRCDKDAVQEVDTQLHGLAKVLLKKQSNLKTVEPTAKEFLNFFKALKGKTNITFANEKHLVQGLMFALREFNSQGKIKTRLTKSGAKEALTDAEMIL